MRPDRNFSLFCLFLLFIAAILFLLLGSRYLKGQDTKKARIHPEYRQSAPLYSKVLFTFD